ncbi:class I SAM-dependent methyltransferase [Nocardia wallacei]|uniref:class I SAM-dependent methyltransferase n=1 Tax=Nocardia wallacei TaxID=480035 RepID=UPI002455A297|nr:methyltransferase domain-containing protein [Nocardia wallacei]
MSRNLQLFPVIVPDENGLLITSPRRYNALNAVIFGGRHRRLLAELVAVGGAVPGDRVLDIGSGPGKLAAALATAVGPGGSVLGIDASRAMVDYARAHAAAANIGFEVGVAQALAVADAEFDLVTCTFVMHHVAAERRADALAEMYRVLRRGGRLLLADAHPTGLMRAVAEVMGRVSRSGADSEQPAARRDPFREVDVRRYADSLVGVGFETSEFRASRYGAGLLTARKAW